METQSENALAQWTTPECPFPIDYSPRVLDDIRLAVMDAFFSLPRGGAEIGGVLLGRHERGRVTITDSMPMDCEHAFGPSFSLSPRDQAKLTDLLADAKRNPGPRPVGWWHSHTRSEIFLSEADQEIHKRFFPEPFQVALVLKPHTFLPTRAGFFFREKDGTIHGEAPYNELKLDPLPMRTVPAAPPLASAGEAETDARVINVTGRAETERRHDAAPERAETATDEVPPPAFLAPAPSPSPRRWTGWVAVALGAALGVAIYTTSPQWLPRAQTMFHAAPPEPVSLNTADQDGQLQIRWNTAASDVRRAEGGRLLIADGPAGVTMPLDTAHLQSGAFSYLRTSDRVDVTLVLALPGGKEVRQATFFAGNPPPPRPAPAAAAPDALVQENAKLKADIARQVERIRQLEKALEELRKVVKRDQQRRLEHQSPDTVK